MKAVEMNSEPIRSKLSMVRSYSCHTLFSVSVTWSQINAFSVNYI